MTPRDDDERVRTGLLERALLRAQSAVGRHVDLERGRFAGLHRRAYFLYKALKDRALVREARALAAPGGLVIDVGANIGFFACALARREDLHVLAFEPEATNFARLLDAARSSGVASRVLAFRVALSDTTGVARLHLSTLAPTDHKLVATRSEESVEVETARLDDFLAARPELAGRPVVLVKVDVQGAELLVLEGMRGTLAAHGLPPILVEFAPDDLRAAGVTPERFFDAFARLGYRPRRLGDSAPVEAARLVAETRDYVDLVMEAERESPGR